MGYRPIQNKNGQLTTESAILNFERMAHLNFKFIGNKWKMAHTMVCPAITLQNCMNKHKVKCAWACRYLFYVVKYSFFVAIFKHRNRCVRIPIPYTGKYVMCLTEQSDA